jgi:hypothetical protein
MLTLFGVSVNAENARRLVASLIVDGSADALDAAETIAHAVSRGSHAVAVVPPMRNAILTVLENPPAGLEDLRGVLARDHRDGL